MVELIGERFWIERWPYKVDRVDTVDGTNEVDGGNGVDGTDEVDGGNAGADGVTEADGTGGVNNGDRTNWWGRCCFMF